MIKKWLSNLTATDMIALYAAIISTMALLWNIINSILEKLPRIKVYAGISARFFNVVGVGVSPPEFIIAIKITNLSTYDMYIEEPSIKLPEKIDEVHDSLFVTSFHENIRYPAVIKPREQLNVYIKISPELIEKLKKIKRKRSMIRIKVEDTTGKVFYSNKLSVEKIIAYGETHID